jgi:uncharacterized protein YqfA (UPF0365 family)
VLHRGLDVGTAFEILSIDIADVDVGENVGANSRKPRPRRTRTWPRPRRKSAAPPPSRSNRKWSPASQEMKAKVVEAEAQVPLAMAEAFRNGQLGVMDYYKMENVKADTQMRGNIAKGDQ